MNNDGGISNPCLKIGGVLVGTALVAMGFTSFFSVDRELQAITRNLGAVALLSGVVIYGIGRLVRARHARARGG